MNFNSDIGTNATLINDDLRQEMIAFRHHLITYIGRPLPEVLWHYTSFDGLSGILKTKSIFSTQLACLNDSSEYLHLPNLIRARLESRIAGEGNSDTKDFFEASHRELGDIDITGTGNFVACLSEDKDDLGQWRGYGGGVCGYAIGFRSDGILKALERRSSSLLVPLVYNKDVHEVIANEIIDFAAKLYNREVAKFESNRDQFAIELRATLAFEMDLVVSAVKHHKFEFEHERRIVTKLFEGEHGALQFRQKSTLLARHLPIDLLPNVDDTLLPIEAIVVGPGPAQKVTQIAVSDLLFQNGYNPNIVSRSDVPYRVP